MIEKEESKRIEDILVCPQCKGELEITNKRAVCRHCKNEYLKKIISGILEFNED